MTLAASLKVWSAWQRLWHWALALSVLVALFTHEGGNLHEGAGYLALALASIRMILGFWGSHAVRFASFTRGYRDTLHYASTVLRGKEARHLNHNPLGAWMVIILLSLALVGGLFGWIYTTDRFWGVTWVGNLHALFTWPFMVLIALHLLGVLLAGLRHRENLVAAMMHGRKRPLDEP